MRELWLMFGVFPVYSQTQNVYLDWPIAVEGYNPYAFGRPLGVYSSFNQKYHTGEDIRLVAGTEIQSIGDGLLKRYQTNGGGTSSCPYVGYGKLYAIIQYSLNRPLKVPVGVSDVTTSSDFTMSFGHILDEQDPNNPDGPSTGIPILDGGNRDLNFSRGQTIGWVAPHTGDCNSDDLNGDGAEHLHHGTIPGLDNLVSGYDSASESGYCPTHLVIAASRIGVFDYQDGSPPIFHDSNNQCTLHPGWSQAFVDKWWEEYANTKERGNDTDNYKYMQLDQYHNKLGRPDDNGSGTDFVHNWNGIWIQDMEQPTRIYLYGRFEGNINEKSFEMTHFLAKVCCFIRVIRLDARCFVETMLLLRV